MKKLVIQLVLVIFGCITLAGFGSITTLLASHDGGTAGVSTETDTTTSIAVVRAQLTDAQRELDRARQIMEYSGRYSIPADLTAQIYDIAVAEGIPAGVGFQLVKIESGFQNTAQSPASAIGLTQLRLPTARVYDATVNSSDLMNADVNLRIGFRYLKDLMARFDEDIPLALEAYNKGPSFVTAAQDSGTDVEGRYSRAVLNGVRKRG